MPADIRVLEAIDATTQRVPAVLRGLKAFHRCSDEEIAAASGMTRSAVQARMSGKTQCSPGELAGFAVFFGVPVSVFYGPVEDALAAMRSDQLVASHRGANPTSACLTEDDLARVA